MSAPEKLKKLRADTEQAQKAQLSDARRYHPDDVRVWIAAALFIVFLLVFGFKVYYASAAEFKETCALDQLFDPVLSGIAGAFTTVLGFYFSEHAVK